MILKLAIRSLANRPIRSLVLACGFGFGVAVMAILLGVGEVILDQARSPALQGGGDLAIGGRFGPIENARFLLSSVLGAGPLEQKIAVRSPSRRATFYLATATKPQPVIVRGGIPSLERAIHDEETSSAPGWSDTPSDRAWASPDRSDVLRNMDRFHTPPTVPEFQASWAEWLYFNGRTPDGSVRFYLTFMVGPLDPAGKRPAGVRLQLQRGNRTENFVSSGPALLDPRDLLSRAPDLDVGGSAVRLDGLQYRISLQLVGEAAPRTPLAGTLTLDAVPGRSMPPTVMHGARGWLSGYVVPVLSGPLSGSLVIGGERLLLDRAIGYHDHNWGFWQDVRWQWGQVAHDDLSFVFGRVFPPASVADPERVPGFLGVMGPDGPVAMTTEVAIAEHDAGGQPDRVEITAHGADVDLRLTFAVDQAIGTSRAADADFLQLAGTYQVSGEAAGRRVEFTARGAAETFRAARTR